MFTKLIFGNNFIKIKKLEIKYISFLELSYETITDCVA